MPVGLKRIEAAPDYVEQVGHALVDAIASVAERLMGRHTQQAADFMCQHLLRLRPDLPPALPVETPNHASHA